MRNEDSVALFRHWSDLRFLQATCVPALPTMAAAEAAVLAFVALNRSGLYHKWAIVDQATGQLIGECEALPTRPQIYPWREWVVGYSLAPEAWGAGFMREAMGAVLQHLFSSPDTLRVRADVLTNNVRSQRLLTRLGFQREGCQRLVHVSGSGELLDQDLWGLTREDWASAQVAFPEANHPEANHPEANGPEASALPA